MSPTTFLVSSRRLHIAGYTFKNLKELKQYTSKKHIHNKTILRTKRMNEYHQFQEHVKLEWGETGGWNGGEADGVHAPVLLPDGEFTVSITLINK